MGKKNNISVGSILIIVGTILIAASLFMGYVTMESIEVFGEKDVESISGMDIITGDGGEMEELSFLHWVPLLALLSATVGLVMAIVPMIAKPAMKKKMNYNLIIAAFMIVSVVLSIIFLTMGARADLYTGTAKDVVEGMIGLGLIEMKLGIGAALGLIGGIIGLVGAAISVKESV